MDVVLGVAVTGPVARLSLIGPAAGGYAVLDESVVDLTMHPIETLTQTLVGTDRLLAGEHHRLVATRLCWPDQGKADELRRALEDSGMHDVTLVSESEATTALVRTTPGDDDDAPPTALAAQPDSTFAIARGAAMAADSPMTLAAPLPIEESTTMAPAAEMTQSGPQEEPQLAYSLVDDADLLPFEESDELDEDEAGTGPSVYDTRSFLISYAVIVFTVVGFSTLAVAVAIAVRPTASQQPVQGHQNATPGKFMPLLPTQQQAPVPPPPPEAPTAGFQGGSIPPAPILGPPGTSPIAPGVPVAPPAPGPAVPPILPPVMPIPIPVPFPQPNPPQPITPQPITPSTTAWSPPTTTPPTTIPPTTTPPTTTVPTTTVPTTTTPPTTAPPTTAPPTTTPMTTIAPTTVPPTTVAPTTKPPTTAAPVTTATQPAPTYTQQTTAAPAPTHTEAPVAPTRRIPGF